MGIAWDWPERGMESPDIAQLSFKRLEVEVKPGKDAGPLAWVVACPDPCFLSFGRKHWPDHLIQSLSVQLCLTTHSLAWGFPLTVMFLICSKKSPSLGSRSDISKDPSEKKGAQQSGSDPA